VKQTNINIGKSTHKGNNIIVLGQSMNSEVQNGKTESIILKKTKTKTKEITN
jgi:hypothetical protein